MQNFLIYILEISVLTSLFFLFYRYLYFKLAYFVWSRYFFYAALLISIIIPVLPEIFNSDLIVWKFEQIIGMSENNYPVFINVPNSYIENHETFFTNFPIVEVLFIVWLSGFLRYMFIISKSIVSTARLIKIGTKKESEGFSIVHTNTDSPAFSFFKYIFVNTDFNHLSDDEQKQIITHEKIHSKQKHTIDNIVFELFRAIFWFNPVSRLITANIKIIHEFIVDNELTGNKNHPDYSKLILKLAMHRSHAITVSSFSAEEIKNRIKLITFPENETIRKRQFIISIPVLIAFIFAGWMIISTVNSFAMQKDETLTKFHFPFKKGSYKIISPFFQNQTPGELYRGKETNILNNKQFVISHPESTYEVKTYTEVYAIDNGTVSLIKEDDIFGLKELTVLLKTEEDYTVQYKGLYKITIKENDVVKKGDIIGLSGDVRLFPSVSIKVEKEGVFSDPEKLY